MITVRGEHIRNTVNIIPNMSYIRTAYELGDILLGYLERSLIEGRE